MQRTVNARGPRANSGGQLCWAGLLAHAECGRRCHKIVALPPEVGHRKRLEVETGEALSRPRLQAGTVSAKLVAALLLEVLEELHSFATEGPTILHCKGN